MAEKEKNKPLTFSPGIKPREKVRGKKEILVLLDSHAILHRAFHALPQSFAAPDGSPTNALYGFAAFLIKAIKEIKPDHIVATYDLPETTFRKVAFKDYKSHRKEMDSALALQINKSKEILAAFEIPFFEFPGFEADDILGTITKQVEGKNIKTIIASGDLDTLQLVKENDVCVYTLKKGINETTVYNEKKVKERFGFAPELIPDYKGLSGDQSDNIPGVKGVGEKTAKSLIQKFGGLEKIYTALERDEGKLEKEGIKKRVIDLLREQKEAAFFSRSLAEIRMDAPIVFSVSELRKNGKANKNSALKIFDNFGFRSLSARLNEIDYFFASDGEEPSAASPYHGAPKRRAAEKTRFKEILKTPKEIFWIYSSSAPVERGDKTAEEKITAVLRNGEIFDLYENDLENCGDFFNAVFRDKKNFAFRAKDLTHFFNRARIAARFEFDFLLAAWLINSRLYNPDLIQILNIFGDLEDSRSEKIKEIFKAKDRALEKLKDEELSTVFCDIEMPLVSPLVEMEKTGILIDARKFKNLSIFCGAKLKETEDRIKKMAGENFNINSTKELRRVLFDKLGIEAKGVRKTDGGVRSTKFSELMKLKDKHPIIEEIIAQRELAKLKSTYIDALPALAKKDGRVHTTFNQTGTVTGRLSSVNPNLQNIPIKGDLGKKIRQAFTAPDGFLLASFDYSQIELRVAALFSKDEKMAKAFRNGIDIHAVAASEIFNVSIEEITSDMRKRAKVINFGILYGMGINALSESLGVSRKEAEEYRDEYFKGFSGFADYIYETLDSARANGFVKTFFGRKRHLEEICSQNELARREAERMAVNMPVQGTAADIMKIAMIKIYEFSKKNKWEDKARMLLQIHDELLFEIREDFLEEAAEIIKNIMEGVMKERAPEIPFPVEVSVGKSWMK